MMHYFESCVEHLPCLCYPLNFKISILSRTPLRSDKISSLSARLQYFLAINIVETGCYPQAFFLDPSMPRVTLDSPLMISQRNVREAMNIFQCFGYFNIKMNSISELPILASSRGMYILITAGNTLTKTIRSIQRVVFACAILDHL
jgi:hypothetical protein